MGAPSRRTASSGSTPTCPSCGEDEALRGRPVGGDIEITCLACGHCWNRGASTCRSCGGSRTVTIGQVLARTSRGNQLSIMGHRDAVLCPNCDAEVISQCQTARQWVPEDYVSAYSYDSAGADEIRSQQESASSAPADRDEPEPDAEPVAQPVQHPEPEPAGESVPAQQHPTVRQAIAAYMAAEPQADALAMLSLGTLLGSATRVEALAGPQLAASLQSWFEQTWGLGSR